MTWLFRRGHLGPFQMLSMLWFILRWSPRFGRHVFKKNKAYLNRLPVSLVANEARDFVASMTEDLWIRPALAELEMHKQRGDAVVLLSGTLQPIVECLSARLGANGAVGTECVVERGRFTASPPLRHPFHDEKADLLTSVCETYCIAAGEVYAYADSGFDIPLLSKVGYPVAVCPDGKLQAWTASHNHRALE